ncbi:hypothetical protein [Clostridium sp.]|uniref:hypothetical protein n=1 Tax=Clostridium sp. TaxID=1506 RepID=UPI001A542447|nr:hypothetical protein [Clostridium sp.]MBK5239853.1 hypothetical protein [Clostridium sp.]
MDIILNSKINKVKEQIDVLGVDVLAITPLGDTTANRPIDFIVGQQYFDTTLGKPIWLKTSPSTWVNSAGVAV